LTLTSTLLIFCGRATFTNLSRYSDLNEKTYRRHYATPTDFEVIHQKLIDQSSTVPHERIGAVDCSFVPKSGKKTEGLAQFFNGSHGKSEQGLEWSLLSVVNLTQNTAYTLNARQTPAQLSDCDESIELETRIDWYLKQIKDARGRLPADIKYLAADAYYSKSKWIDGLLQLKLHAIGKLRRDSRLKYFYTGPQKPRGRKRKYAGYVDYGLIDSPPQDAAGFEFVATVDDGIDLYRAWVYSEAFKRAIQVVYLHKVTPSSSSYVLLYCTDEQLSAVNVYRYYKARFLIEFIFRDSKQYLGLTHCQARDSQKLEFHVNSVLLTLNLLKVHWFNQQAELTQEDEPKKPFSVANYKRRAFNEYLLSTFISRLGLEQTLDKSQPEYLQCLQLGLIAS
jgi:hypothetical protein